MTDIKYPIYKIIAKWIQNGDHSKYEPDSRWIEGMPEGRMNSSTSFSKMFKEEQTQEQLDEFAKDWWKRYTEHENNKELEMELTELTVKYKEHESWLGTWFQHYTFDVGQTDNEVLNSFEQFVRRYEHQQGREFDNPLPENYHCLMGAEDRWRWSGGDEEGKQTNGRLPPPCRCKYCKEQGVIRISH